MDKKKVKLGFWQMFRIAGVLMGGISQAAVDGKLTLNEGIALLAAICKLIGIDFDDAGVEIDS